MCRTTHRLETEPAAAERIWAALKLDGSRFIYRLGSRARDRLSLWSPAETVIIRSVLRRAGFVEDRDFRFVQVRLRGRTRIDGRQMSFAFAGS